MRNSDDMKEKKKKIDNVIPSRGKIIFAWVLLILLVAMVLGLYYLKNYYKVKDDEPIVDETHSSVITGELTKIVDNFNNNSLINTYNSEGLNLEARLEELTIVVKYNLDGINGILEYSYDKQMAILMSSNLDENKEINDKIFKIMVLAVQERLGNTKGGLEEKIDSFIDDNAVIVGLEKEINETGYVYKINIVNEILLDEINIDEDINNEEVINNNQEE